MTAIIRVTLRLKVCGARSLREMERYPSIGDDITFNLSPALRGSDQRTRGPRMLHFVYIVLSVTNNLLVRTDGGVIPPLMPRGGNYLIKNQFPPTITTTAARLLRSLLASGKSHFAPYDYDLSRARLRRERDAAVLGEISVYRTELQQRTDVCQATLISSIHSFCSSALLMLIV